MFMVEYSESNVEIYRTPVQQLYKDDVEVCCLIWRQTDQSTYGHIFFS